MRCCICHFGFGFFFYQYFFQSIRIELSTHFDNQRKKIKWWKWVTILGPESIGCLYDKYSLEFENFGECVQKLNFLPNRYLKIISRKNIYAFVLINVKFLLKYLFKTLNATKNESKLQLELGSVCMRQLFYFDQRCEFGRPFSSQLER